MVEINKTHTPNTQRQITFGKRAPNMSLDAFEFLFFDRVRETSNDVNTFSNLRFMKKQKPADFLKKKFLRFRKFFVVPKTFSKIKKIPAFYMYTDISRTAMIFEAKIFLHEFTKSTNSQQIINPHGLTAKL